MKNIKVVSCFLFALLVTGCASVSKMPLQVDSDHVDLSKKSILVAKVHIKNEFKESHQPELCCMFVQKNGEDYSFTSPTMINDLGENGKEYFVSMDVDPGLTTINMARFVRKIPLLLWATADLPFSQEIDVPQNSIVYLGDITAVIKEKTSDDQPSAGGPVPLLDQAITGFSTGTFEVVVKDKYKSDVEELRQKYMSLKGMKVVDMTLPAWIHPEKRAGNLSLSAQN
ncbi:MAG: hypothetical protein H7A09_11810 [Oceanospirillaceae bacterium]|nr:hypothetical protein [Oceanospirillaceae bacterium]MCP5349871.1 hypothetical protein [Oceanospirillaceae bacterium]